MMLMRRKCKRRTTMLHRRLLLSLRPMLAMMTMMS